MSRGPRPLTLTYRTGILTRYADVYLVPRFMRAIGFKRAVATYVRLPQRNHHYSVTEMILAVLYPMLLGLERLEMTASLRQNGVLQYLAGLSAYPDPQSLRRFLRRQARV